MTVGRHVSSWRWSTIAALYFGLTALYCWPLFLSFGTALPNDTGDPGLLAFIMWWNAHTVPFTDHWWNLPMFFPATGTMAFSETMLGASFFSTPLLWAGFSAVETHNVLFVLSIPTAALAAHALAHYLTGRHDIGLIAGLAFGFSPYRASQMPHLQLLITVWMPLGLLALHRYLDQRRRRDLWLLGVCWLLNGLTTGYYLVFYAVLVGFWMLWFVRERRDWIAILGTLALSSLPFVPLVLGYTRIQRAYGFIRGQNEIEFFSADLTAFLSSSPHAVLPHLWSYPARAEGELYPGLTIVALTIAGAWTAWRAAPRLSGVSGRLTVALVGVLAMILALVSWSTGGFTLEIAGAQLLSLTRPHRIVTIGLWCFIVAGLMDRRIAAAWRGRSTLIFYVLAACAIAVLALGPVARVNDVRFMHMAPYAWLMHLPGGGSLRVPARFGMLLMLCLTLSAALSLARLTPRGGRAWLIGLLALAVTAEGWVPNMRIERVQPSVSLPGLDAGTVVLEVPSRDLWSDTAAMLRATVHGHPVVNGFSGYGPPHYEPMHAGLAEADGSVITALRQIAPLAVLVNRSDDREGSHEAFISGQEGARLAYRTPVGPVYRFARMAPPARSTSDTLLHVAAARASVYPQGLPALTDAAQTTQWYTPRPQARGDLVGVTFDREVVVSRLEMDLGAAPMNYPRELRIDARRDDGSMATVWHGGTAGQTISALIERRENVPVIIDLPPGTIARELILVLTRGDRDFYWTIAEFRAYGR